MVEGLGHLGYHGTDGHHIQIGKGQIRIGIEVFVADVAAAHDGRLVVHGERLAVHAIVDVFEAGDPLQIFGRFANKGIEQAHFYLRVSIQGGPYIVGVAAVDVVDEHTHPHSPVGRLDQLIDEQFPHRILVEHVVLHVDAAFGQTGQQGAPHEGIQSTDQQDHARLIRVVREVGGKGSAEAGFVPIINGE